MLCFGILHSQKLGRAMEGSRPEGCGSDKLPEEGGDKKLHEKEGGEKLPEETPTGKLIMPCTEKVLFFGLSLVK